MKKAEIDSKFDEIVDFSGVEKFLDTPVKRYSSGMKVRLAFAVAAHLEPEILIVDEVLAVGDAAFQKKCLGKMQDVSTGAGRTVLFVSHNMGAVSRLSTWATVLQDGSMAFQGSVDEAVTYYFSGMHEHEPEFRSIQDNHKQCQFVYAVVATQRSRPAAVISCDEQFQISFKIRFKSSFCGVYFGVCITRTDGTRVLFTDSRDLEANRVLTAQPESILQALMCLLGFLDQGSIPLFSMLQLRPAGPLIESKGSVLSPCAI